MKTPTAGLAIVFLIISFPRAGSSQEPWPQYLRDRGTGLPSSMFGTYIRKGELLVYPFYEYYYDNTAEYKPAELGYGLDRDFQGRYRAHEGLLFLGYGLTDWLAIEVEAAVITATLRKSRNDPSALPARWHETGLGDVETQLRFRWASETAGRPEWFGFFETVYPFRKDKVLIGTQNWELKLGAGLVKGLPWGTVTLRTALAYDDAERVVEVGEYAVEYLRRLSDRLRVVALIEGEQDEVELITELQVYLSPSIFVKLNNGLGLTWKAVGVAPEVGVMMSLLP